MPQWSPGPLSSGAAGLLSPHFGRRERRYLSKSVPPGPHTASVLPVGDHRPVETARPVGWRGGEGEGETLYQRRRAPLGRR